MSWSRDDLIRELPNRLLDRSRCLNAPTLNEDGEFVLYWMRTAVRVDENPALDVAIELANRLGQPVFVYHALSERYPYASDRHHAFILEGAKDVQKLFASKGIGYALHLERPGHRGPHLRTLSRRASFVVTEDMPVAPLWRWTATLARQTSAPVVAVDTACVVPMQVVGKAYDRAFEFRNATQDEYAQRLTLSPHHVDATVAANVPDLPFEPVDLQTTSIADLVSQCDIDHAIGPVPHTVGGTIAGYERWNSFKQHGIASYSKKRNDAMLDGVSRMSAYLHYGMVSPMRMAREAAEIDNEGAEKYLDELLIWRELAYVFCFYRPDHGRLTSIPEWAQDTLAEHEADKRHGLYSWETLARGQTGDVLWDAAQKSLLIHGELHNNVRMTWGKAILNWTPSAKAALAMLVDLNHRYALDGRDPASYGGLLWCLGQFDRPFAPDKRVFGTVRVRSTEQHALRLDPTAFLNKTTRPATDLPPTVAVVGAGISGLMCARTLSDHGIPVKVLEKSRGVGGRMATRRALENLRFDHGAQYFTARDARFQRYVRSWIRDGLVEPWEGQIVVLDNGCINERKSGRKRGTGRYVAVPGMNSVCRHLASGLDIRLQTKVAPLDSSSGRWNVRCEAGNDLGTFDAVIVSAPAPQAASLLAPAPLLAAAAGDTAMSGCWALMLAFHESLGLDFDGAFVHNSPVSWIAKNSSKPTRSSKTEVWVVHGAADWSQAHMEESPAVVEKTLLHEFWEAVGITPTNPMHMAAHRWRFAIPSNPLADGCLFDREKQIGACGDWCAGSRVEGAFLSGVAAAGRVLGLLSREV